MAVPYQLTSQSRLTPAPLQPALTHMNKDHVHNMTNIVQAHCGLSRPPTKVVMTAIDYEGFEVKYRTTPASLWGRNAKPRSSGVRIPWKGGKIDSPKDARVQLVALSEQSDKVVGKVCRQAMGVNGAALTPRDHFLSSHMAAQTRIIYSPPVELPLSILLWSFLYAIENNPQLKQTIKSNLPALIHSLAAKSPIQLTIPQLLTQIFRAHALESLLMLAFVVYRASGSRATVSPFTALAWAASTFTIGFPTFFKFRLLNPPVTATKK